MKPNAPWSVKGIERDARATAKEAARREGMTVGEWLSQVIQSAGDPAASNGEIVGIKTADIVTAIEILNRRALTAEAKSAAAIEDLARGFAKMAERVQRAESAPAGAPPAAIEDRVAALESKVSEKGRLDSLKALERAISQIAVQFDAGQRAIAERQKDADRKLDETVRRLEANFSRDNALTAVAGVRDAVDAMSARLVRAEKIASEAARLNAEAARAVDPAFVEQTGNRLRVLGDEIKRGGDQIRALESSIRRMAEQIDAAEKRSAEGVQKVADTIADLRSQFEQSDKPAASTQADIDAAIERVTLRTEERMSRLQRSFEDMIARLDAAEPAGAVRRTEAIYPAERTPPTPTAPARPATAASLMARPESASPAVDVTADADDDFRFDLDLDEADDADPFADADPDALDTPVAARATPAQGSPPPPTPPDSAPAALASQSDAEDLDAVLRALDGFDEPPPAAPPPSQTDFLKRARLQAKEMAEQMAREEAQREQARKSMSPKQKAILAAKARRKKLAEQGLSDPLPSTPPVEGRRADDVRQKAPAAAGQGAARRSIIESAGGMLASLQKKRAGAAEIDEFTPSSDLRAAARRGKPGGVKALISATSAAKPVHLAIGAATVVLAGGALYFVTANKNPPARKTSAADVPQQERMPLPTEVAPEVPAPSVEPRGLYFDSVAKLRSAKSDEARKAAVDELRQAATLGHPPAQLQLGELYKLGQDLPQDLALARTWYLRAAAGGNVLAMHRAGVMLARGQGGPVDADGAIGWFERAANLGLMDSQYNLGAIYHPGGDQSTQSYQNAALAYFWYALAARNGDGQAAQLAASLGSGLKKDERRKADDAVAAWKPQTPDPTANEIAPST